MWVAGTGPDLWGADGTTTTSKIFVPSETKRKLIGTIKDDDLQDICNTIKRYRHFLNILLPHQLYKIQTPRWQSKMLLDINKTTKLYGQTSLRKRLIVFFYWHQVNISIKEAQSLLYMAKNEAKNGHFCSSGNIGPTSKINIVCVCWTEKAAMYSFQTIIAFLRYRQYLLVKLKSWQSKSNLFLLDLVLQEKQWLMIQCAHYKLQPSWILLQIAWEFPQAKSLKEMDDKI